MTRRTRDLLDFDLWPPKVYMEVHAERQRAHAKHGATSIEARPFDDPARLPILVEEVGEVAAALNDHRHSAIPNDAALLASLRHELVQVAAVAVSWVDAIDQEEPEP
jgi:NTP pyrophosphatase (non-canonical NTP hydrolase)